MRDKMRMLKKHLLDVVETGEIVLASGKKSDFYIDARKVTLDSRASGIISEIFIQKMNELNVSVVSGLVIGADPIVGAVVGKAGDFNSDIRGLLVRKEPKRHGRRRQIEGPDIERGREVLVVDDVATSGGSLIKAAEILRDAGFSVSYAMVVVDRQEGARQALSERGIELFSVFTKQDLMQ